MTMNVRVADGMDMSTLKTGVTLHVEITRDKKNQLTVSQVHIPPSGEIDDSYQRSPGHGQH